MNMRAISSVFSVAGLLACVSIAGAGPLQDRISSGEPIRQGIANDAPFGFVDQSGKTVGIEVELFQTIAGKLGAGSIEQIGTTFGALIPGIQAKRFDVASDGIYVRAERCRAVAFSRPHFMIAVGAFVKKGSAIEAQGLEDLAKIPDLRIGILTGAGEGKYYIAAGGRSEQILDFADRAGLAAGLTSDRIDVAFLTSMGAAATVANNPELSLLSPFRPPVIDGKPQVSFASFAFSKDDADFAEAFSKELSAYMDSPEYPALLAKYGVTTDVIPDMSVTIDDLCK